MPGCRHAGDPTEEEGADRARGRADLGLAAPLRGVRAAALLQGRGHGHGPLPAVSRHSAYRLLGQRIIYCFYYESFGDPQMGFEIRIMF